MSSLLTLRQSAAELLALVVIELFPGALLVQSDVNEFGFYIDILATQPIDDYALPLLEEKMRFYVKENLEVCSQEMMRENAATFLEYKEQPIRAQEVRLAEENIVSLIKIGDFYDYCPLPYITETQEVGAFKVFNIEKVSYYLLEEGMVEVKRIHGVVSTDKQSLKKEIKSSQAGRKADHIKCSKERNFFSFYGAISDYAWVWESNGTLLKKILTHWWESEHHFQDFQFVSTPSLVKESLVRKEGIHDSQSFSLKLPVVEIHEISYRIAPPRAPAHMTLFSGKFHNEREMPIRYAECAPVWREKTGNLWGILNSRVVNADYAHIFCTPKHVEEEIISSLQFIDKTIKMFGFEYYWNFIGRGDKFAGSLDRWEKATNSLNSACEKCGFSDIKISPEVSFTGPLLEARLIDRFGREWKGPTVGLDFNAPEKFALRYQGTDNKSHIPLVIVRSLFGSLERFVALLLEHRSGVLPLWLSPEQMRIIPVKEEYDSYAKRVNQAVREAGYRTKIDCGPDSIGKKVAKAEGEKIPYIVILGEKEKSEDLITVYSGVCELHQQSMTLDVLLKLMAEEVSSKALHSKLRNVKRNRKSA